jgi:hypothetical protein
VASIELVILETEAGNGHPLPAMVTLLTWRLPIMPG